MFTTLFRHPNVGAVANWLGITLPLAAGIGWLLKQIPDWFGKLSWPQSILLGFGIAVGTLFVFAATVAMFKTARRAQIR